MSDQPSLNLLTSSAAGSPASPSQSPENSSPKMTHVGSGRTSHESFAHYDPDTSSLRTCQACLFGGLETYSETFPRSGTMLSGKLYRRQPLVRLTDGIGSGLWPTPTVTDKQGHGWQTAGKGKALTLAGAARVWPTPTQADGMGGPGNGGRDGGDNPRTAVSKIPDVKHGQLNPTWVEWLMGYPEGWTDLKDSETP